MVLQHRLVSHLRQKQKQPKQQSVWELKNLLADRNKWFDNTHFFIKFNFRFFSPNNIAGKQEIVNSSPS